MPLTASAEDREYKYNVWGHAGSIIGYADNFSDAKQQHKDTLPEELLPYYAGLDCHGLTYDYGARPVFYSAMPHDLAQKYGIIAEGM